MENKKVRVTGGNRGIGKGIVEGFLNNGNEVLASCRDVSKFPLENDRLTVAELDIADTRSVDNFKNTVESFGPEILVNNAGITKDNIFLRMSDDEWLDVINTNLTGTFRVTKLVAKGMLKQKWGRIINISSISGMMGNPGQANYSASKSGIDGFTRSLAKELGSRNITVNSVAPGFIATDMTDSLTDEELTKKIPLGRIGNVEDVVSLVLFLASEDSNYITIKSPIIGTFYRKPSPDKPNFVEVGDSISEGSVLCVIEAMKLFNDIESEVSGKIVKILVDDSSPVEFDQPLFLVDPS